MERNKFILGFNNSLSVACFRCGDGLASLWKKDVNLSILSYSQLDIDAHILDDEAPQN